MMRNSLFLFALIFLGCLSCAPYTKVGYSPDKVVNQSPVKVSFKAGGDKKYDSLTSNGEGVFFAIRGNKKSMHNATEIDEVRLSIGHVYKVVVYLMASKERIKGYLYKVEDDALVLSNVASPTEDSAVTALYDRVKIEDISSLYVHRVGSVAKGYRIGTLTGMGAGFTMGVIGTVAYGADETTAFGLFALTGMAGILGSIVGLAAGSSSWKTFAVNGSHEKFNGIKYKLKTGTVPELRQ